MKFEAFKLPRGNVVVDVHHPNKEMVAELPSIEEANLYAHELNHWLAARPLPNREFRVFIPPIEPTASQLYMLIERIYEPEERLKGLQNAVRQAAKMERVAGGRRNNQKRLG